MKELEPKDLMFVRVDPITYRCSTKETALHPLSERRSANFSSSSPLILPPLSQIY